MKKIDKEIVKEMILDYMKTLSMVVVLATGIGLITHYDIRLTVVLGLIVLLWVVLLEPAWQLVKLDYRKRVMKKERKKRNFWK